MGPAFLARGPAAAPLPRLAGAGEADFFHQLGNRCFVEADRGCEFDIDGLVAARRTDLVSVAGEAVGEIDAQPLLAEPPVGERSASSIRLTVECGGSGGGKPRHRHVGADGLEDRPPLLRRGLKQGGNEHIQRPKTDAELVQSLAIVLLQSGNCRDQGASSHRAAGIGEHGGDRAYAR